MPRTDDPRPDDRRETRPDDISALIHPPAATDLDALRAALSPPGRSRVPVDLAGGDAHRRHQPDVGGRVNRPAVGRADRGRDFAARRRG
jgi:hypothetical protein